MDKAIHSLLPCEVVMGDRTSRKINIAAEESTGWSAHLKNRDMTLM